MIPKKSMWKFLETKGSALLDKIINAFDGKTWLVIIVLGGVIYYMFGYFNGRLSFCEKQRTEESIAYQVKIAEIIVDRDNKVKAANEQTLLISENCKKEFIAIIQEMNEMKKKMKHGDK